MFSQYDLNVDVQHNFRTKTFCFKGHTVNFVVIVAVITNRSKVNILIRSKK